MGESKSSLRDGGSVAAKEVEAVVEVTRAAALDLVVME